MIKAKGKYYNGDKFKMTFATFREAIQEFKIILQGAGCKNAIKAFPERYVDPDSLEWSESDV